MTEKRTPPWLNISSNLATDANRLSSGIDTLHQPGLIVCSTALYDEWKPFYVGAACGDMNPLLFLTADALSHSLSAL